MPALDEAASYALAHETPWPRDLRAHIEAGFFEAPPHNEILGPIRPRGGPNGLVMRGGRAIAKWGDTRQVDFTFSVAKSYLSLLAGIAVADGLIRELDEQVAATVQDGGFEGPHNGAITWRHLLQQTSEWEGTLFGKSDVIDRNRNLAVEGKGRKGDARLLQSPGTFWEYNDVRVNRLALALLHRFRRPLPEVFAERIMQPIGASADWTWQGYRTSVVEIDGRSIESVSGGSHWGGGGGDRCRGPGAHRAADAAARRVGGAAAAARCLDRRVADAVPAQSELRAAVVAEHRAPPLCPRVGGELLCGGGGRQHHLGRSGE
ncbi:MAG: serine hydrolase [Acetobacteraceae bacterium]